MKQMLNVALPKGRLGEKVYAMFEKAGFECPSIKETNRKLIRTITMEAETADLDSILADLDAQLATLGGYVQNKSVQNGRNGGRRYATLTLRIPADQVDNFVNHVKSATNILSSSEKAEDVTLKYSATESRLKALETEETSKQLLAQLAEYKTKERVASYKAKLMSAGYDDPTASTMATALPEGVEDSFFDAQKAFLDNTKQAVKTQTLNAQPSLSVGTPPSTPKDATSTVDDNLRRWIGLK